MFLTYRDAEIPIRAVLGGNGPLHWTSVDIAGSCPLLLVEWHEGDNANARRRRSLMGSLSEFERFVLSIALRGQISSAQLLTPPDINKTGSWLLEPLVEVSEGCDPEDDYLCGIYRVLGGNVYLESPEAGLSELSKRRPIYRASIK